MPAYIKHASRHVELLKSIFKACNNDSLNNYFESGKLDINNDSLGVLKPKAVGAFKKLKSAAERAGISVKELVRRIEFMPTEVAYDEYLNPEDILRDEEDRLNLVLLVDSFKRHFTDIEEEIVNDIMDDVPYSKIAKKFGKSTPWVRHQLINMKKKLERRMGHIEFDL